MIFELCIWHWVHNTDTTTSMSIQFFWNPKQKSCSLNSYVFRVKCSYQKNTEHVCTKQGSVRVRRISSVEYCLSAAAGAMCALTSAIPRWRFPVDPWGYCSLSVSSLLQVMRRPLPGFSSLVAPPPPQTGCMVHASKWIEYPRPQFLNGSLRLASMNDFYPYEGLSGVDL